MDCAPRTRVLEGWHAVLESMMRDNMDEIVGQVASATDSTAAEAEGFVRTVVGIMQDEAAAGRLDVEGLARGDTTALKNAVRDAASFEKLGGLVGAGAEMGEKGVEAMAIPMSDSLQNIGRELGGLDKVIGQILGTAGGGGILGIVDGILGGGARAAQPPAGGTPPRADTTKSDTKKDKKSK